jgi:hypothetical protein
VFEAIELRHHAILAAEPGLPENLPRCAALRSAATHRGLIIAIRRLRA